MLLIATLTLRAPPIYIVLVFSPSQGPKLRLLARNLARGKRTFARSAFDDSRRTKSKKFSNHRDAKMMRNASNGPSFLSESIIIRQRSAAAFAAKLRVFMVASNDGDLERSSLLFLPNTSQVGRRSRSANGKRSMAAICGAKSRANLECAFRDDDAGGEEKRSVEGK